MPVTSNRQGLFTEDISHAIKKSFNDTASVLTNNERQEFKYLKEEDLWHIVEDVKNRMEYYMSQLFWNEKSICKKLKDKTK